jgi:hypothetical protein
MAFWGKRVASPVIEVVPLSLVVTMFVREGIVMAADSRLTLNNTVQQNAQVTNQLSVTQTDSNFKVFLAPGNVGIATFGMGDIGGVPIAGYIESFMEEMLAGQQVEIDRIPGMILDYFTAMKVPPATYFHIGGYKLENGRLVQYVFEVNIPAKSIKRVNKPDPKGSEHLGSSWGGETDLLSRLLNPSCWKGADGRFYDNAQYNIPWQFFTLQDAIDFAVFAVRTTADTMRFQPRPKTVGGPIDVLVIKPKESFWVQKKTLHL